MICVRRYGFLSLSNCVLKKQHVKFSVFLVKTFTSQKDLLLKTVIENSHLWPPKAGGHFPVNTSVMEVPD